MQAKPREPKIVHISILLYRYLVGIYPSAFRQQYGELMQQVFRDRSLQINHQQSLMGWVRLWGSTLVDTLLSVIEQYSNRGAVMTNSSWIKLSGWFMTASSGLLLISWLAGTRPVFNEYNHESWPIDRFLNAAVVPLMSLGLVLLAAGILGLRARFGKQAGRFGQGGLIISLAGTITALVGFIGLSISDSSPWWETAMAGLTLLFTGLILFGIRCTQRKLLSRWNSLPLLTSTLWPLLIVIYLLLSSITHTEIEIPGAVTGVIIIGAFGGVGLLGYQLQADTGKPQSEPA